MMTSKSVNVTTFQYLVCRLLSVTAWIGSVTSRHGTPNQSAHQVFNCGYKTFLVKTLTRWPPNVHVARYKLLHGSFVRKQHFLPLSESPMAMTSGKVPSLFLHHLCQLWLSCCPVGLQQIIC